MRLAIVSDIHSNAEAFRQVLSDMDHAGVDLCVSLGDNIGYGPDPEEVLTLIRERGIPSVIGNHELALLNSEYLAWFNDLAKRSLMLTKENMTPNSIAYCSTFPYSMVAQNCLCVHGCPPDSPLTYLIELTDEDFVRLMSEMQQDICFVGHTHLLELIQYDGHDITRSQPGQEKIYLDEGYKYIINSGSVGQPRDGNNSAKYLIWDDTERLLEVRFIEYDINVTAERIIELGMPQQHAHRLW